MQHQWTHPQHRHRTTRLQARGQHLSITSLLVVVALVWLAPLASLFAQTTTPQPILLTVSPPVAQIGTTAELTITGTDLDLATSLHFSQPGVTCAPKLDGKQKPVANKFIVTVPPGIATTTCDVRAVARYGISNPRGFTLTSLPVALVPATATSQDKAFTTPLNATLYGTAVKQATTFIRFDAKKGQRITAICQPLLIDSRLDAIITLRHPSGSRLARMKPDGLLDFTASTDGPCTLELQDLMYRGDAESPFILTLTTGPVLQHAFDAGAQWTLYGHNLSTATAPPATPSATPLQRLQVPAQEARQMLSLNPIKATLFGPENDPPAATPQPVALKLPAHYNGWFAPLGQARLFTFAAKKGTVLWIEINCASNGIAADPYLIVQKDDAFIAEAADRAAIATKLEFDHGTADPSYRFEAKEDGTYRVKLRNLFTHAAQEPFELTIQPAGTDYQLVALPNAPPKAKTIATVDINAAPLWRGGVSVFKVFALRRSGFEGPIELSADGLPTDVKLLSSTIRAGQSIGYASFFAEETAQPWAGSLKLHGQTSRAARGATPVFKVASTAKESVLTRLTDDVVLSVVASDAPVSLEATQPLIETDASAKLSIPLQIKRRSDCTEAIKLTSIGVDGITADIAAKATTSILTVDMAKLKLPAGDHPLLLQAVVKFKHKRNEDPKAAAKELTFLLHSKPIILRVKPAPKKP